MALFNLIKLIIIICVIKHYETQVNQKRYLFVGQSAKLKCGASDKYYNIQIKYQWEKPIGNIISREPEIILKDVDFKDGGEYICRISQNINNKIKETLLSTEILINERDKETDTTSRIIEPSIQFKDIPGESIDLQETDYLYTSCEVSNWVQSDYTVQWLINGQNINGANNVLFKSPLNSNRDTGYYTCRITHKSNLERKFEKTLLVNIKSPEIIITVLPEENLKIGGRIFRKCELKTSKYTNNDPIEFSWVKDNNVEVSKTSLLDLPIKDTSVNGRYNCVMKSTKLNKSYIKEYPIAIDIYAPPVSGSYKITVFTTPMSPELNEEFKLKCEVNPPFPNSFYRWKKDNQIISDQQTLIIPSFKKNDVGSYSCEITNSAGDNIISSGKSSENILVKFPYSSKTKIELEEGGSKIISQVGDKREMHCEIPTTSTSRGKDVRWFFNNQPVNSGIMASNGIHKSDHTFVSILTILNIQQKNEGEYTCQFENFVKKVNLIVLQSDASLTINPERLIRNEGDPTEFHCRATGIGDFTNTEIIWTFRSRNGQINNYIINNDKRWDLTNSPDTPETSFISVDQSKYQDDGFYTCTLKNGMSKTAELIIKKKEDNLLLTITPEEVRVRDGQPVIVECFSISQKTREPYGEPRFTMAAGKSLAEDPRITEETVGKSRIRLSIKDGLQTSDNQLKVECHAGIETRSATIFLENQCPPNSRRCSDGNCLPSAKFCDGFQDCSDGSDENPKKCNQCDPLVTSCQNNGDKIPIKSTFLVHWKCDGENDCGNNFDESKCNEEDMKCGNIKFNCSNGKVIPRAYQCDKEPDCPNGEDENGCIAPQITSTPGDKVKRVRKGSSIELVCESYGIPKPFTIWRHNWGCLRDLTRMQVVTITSNCNKIISTLRIMNFQPGDDGIYNCETLSGQNRAFSDDYQLILESI